MEQITSVAYNVYDFQHYYELYAASSSTDPISCKELTCFVSALHGSANYMLETFLPECLAIPIERPERAGGH